MPWPPSFSELFAELFVQDPKWRLDLLGAGRVEVALDGSIGITAAELEAAHADPADRMIIASALITGAALLTADRSMLDWPGHFDRRDARL